MCVCVCVGGGGGGGGGEPPPPDFKLLLLCVSSYRPKFRKVREGNKTQLFRL